MSYAKLYPNAPHDFFPYQAYLIFRRSQKPYEMGYQRHGLPRRPGSRSSRRTGGQRLQLNNTCGNCSFSIAKTMEIDAHPPCGAENFRVRGSRKSTRELDDREGAHMLLPKSIISFNSSEDIEDEEERGRPCRWGDTRRPLVLRETCNLTRSRCAERPLGRNSGHPSLFAPRGFFSAKITYASCKVDIVHCSDSQ